MDAYDVRHSTMSSYSGPWQSWLPSEYPLSVANQQSRTYANNAHGGAEDNNGRDNDVVPSTQLPTPPCHVFRRTSEKKMIYSQCPVSDEDRMLGNSQHSRDLLLGDDGIPVQRERKGSPDLSMRKWCSKGVKYPALLVLSALAIFTLIVLYSIVPMIHLTKGKFFATSASDSILILRILSEGNTVLLMATVASALEYLQWSLASREGGLSLLSFLSLDAGTWLVSLLRLIKMPRRTDNGHMFLAVFRIFFLCLIPFSGVVIMANIRAIPVYRIKSSFSAAAGIADFYPPSVTNLTTIHYMGQLVEYGKFLSDPTESVALSPLPRGQGHCRQIFDPTSWLPCEESYFLPGGMTFVTPIWDDFTTFPDATAYIVPRTKGYHVELGGVIDERSFRPFAQCRTYGGQNGALQLCLSVGSVEEILFSVLPCPRELMLLESCITDTSWKSNAGLATSLAVYRRRATVYYSRNNFSILSIDELSPAIHVDIPISGLFTVFDGLFNFTSLGNIQPNSGSPLALFAASILPISDVRFSRKFALRFIRNFLVVPLNYFTTTIDPAQEWGFQGPARVMPADMYTNVSLAVPSYHVAPGKGSLWAFAGLSGTPLVLCLFMFAYATTKTTHRPCRTGYSTLDFAVHCLGSRDEGSLGRTLASYKTYAPSSIRDEIREMQVVCR